MELCRHAGSGNFISCSSYFVLVPKKRTQPLAALGQAAPPLTGPLYITGVAYGCSLGLFSFIPGLRRSTPKPGHRFCTSTSYYRALDSHGIDDNRSVPLGWTGHSFFTGGIRQRHPPSEGSTPRSSALSLDTGAGNQVCKHTHWGERWFNGWPRGTHCTYGRCNRARTGEFMV